MTNSDAKLHPMDTLARRFMLAVNKLGGSTLIIDHAHNAKGGAVHAIASLIALSDPSYDVPLDVTEYQDLAPRLGVIVASHKSPGDLFRANPEALHSFIDAGLLLMKPFADAEWLAEALRQSDLGLEDIDLRDTSDRLMVEWILAVTRGRQSLITPLLQLVDVVTRAFGNARPNLKMLETALPFQREMRDLVLRRKGEPVLVENEDGSWPRPTEAPLSSSNKSSSSSSKGGRKGRAATLREQAKHKEAAVRERRKMNRRSNVNLPGM